MLKKPMKSILLYFLLLQSFGLMAVFAFPTGISSDSVSAENDVAHSPERAITLLDSPKAADRAWGAYLAGRYHLANLQPKLASLLPEILAGSDQYLINSFLEAEIQLGAALPEEMMRTIYRSFPCEAIVLFSKAPENYGKILLSLFQKERISLEWFALGNLLLKIKDREFLVHMMMEIKQIPIDILVYDIFSEEGWGGSGGPGFDYQKAPLNYPPYIYYGLRALLPSHLLIYFRFPVSSNLDVDLAFPGPVKVFAERIVAHPGDNYVPENIWREYRRVINSRPPDIYEFRQQYVSAFLELPAEDVALEQALWMKWEGKAKYKSALSAHCRKILAKYDRIIALLVSRGLISSSQAKTLEGSISLKIKDSRKVKTAPLPGISLHRVIIEKQHP
jgi:hypothetical protein